ncbi:hypothetical protein KKH82_05825 [Patescibacteria group bacterium]|nr:hypothetical protein [Patescibacteria group bacterium]
MSTETTTVTDFDIQNASQNMKELQSSIDSLTDQLYDMDAKERGNDVISTQYKETRDGVVDVIANINTTAAEVNNMLKKIAVFKQQILKASEELNASKEGMTVTREYLADFANFIFKLDNQLYDKDHVIDNIKLLANSDNIPLTLSNDYMVQSLAGQLNELMGSFSENTEKQTELIKTLSKLKMEALGQINNYQIEIEKMQQKKNYLVQFLALYRNDKVERQVAITQLFESTKGVYDKVMDLVRGLNKEVYKVTEFNMENKIKELNLIEKDNETYPLAWPVYPIEEIQTYFADELYQKKYGVQHIGIQIKSTQ